MPRTFISYRRSDSSTISGRIYDHLVRVFGDSNVFKDVYDIPAGSDFRKVIEDNINACHAQLIVIGPTWLDTKAADGTRRLDDPDDAVRIEVETGLTCRDILLIPILVSGATMPKPEQLPESIRDLSFRNAIFIRDDPDFRGDIDHLITVLRQLGARENTTRWRRRAPYVGGLVVVALVLALAAAYVIANNQGTRLDVIVSDKTGTHVLVILPTAQGRIDTTLPALSATPNSAGSASATPSPAGALSATPSPAGAATGDVAGAVALIRQGDALQDQGNYQEALDRYSQAITLDPGSSEAYISRASVYNTLGTNFDLAVQDAQTAIRIDPNNYWNYDELGKIYFSAGQYDLSVQSYSHALKLEANPSGYYGRGTAYHLLKDYDHALADLTRSIQLDPNNEDTYQERAWTNFESGHYSDAILDFTAVLERSPDSSSADIGRGISYRKSGKLSEAIDDLTRALALEPDSKEAYYERGYAHQLNGDYSEASSDYQAALKLDSSYIDVQIQFARLDLDDLNDSDGALQHAQQAVDLNEANPYAQAVLGDVYYAQGKKEDALLHYRRYVELTGSDAAASYLTRIHELESP